MFSNNKKLEIKYDYVTCHNNILLKAKRANKHSTISKEELKLINIQYFIQINRNGILN